MHYISEFPSHLMCDSSCYTLVNTTDDSETLVENRCGEFYVDEPEEYFQQYTAKNTFITIVATSNPITSRKEGWTPNYMDSTFKTERKGVLSKYTI